MRAKYVLSSPDHMQQAVEAHKMCKIRGVGKKVVVIDEVHCLVTQAHGPDGRLRRRVLTWGGAGEFLCIPVREADLSLGIVTRAPLIVNGSLPTPFSALASEIVTNLDPLTHAVKSGAYTTAKEFRDIITEDHTGQTPVTPVRVGKYDSLKHPGDTSWVSADLNTVLTWWGGARYGTNVSFLMGTDYEVSTTDTGSTATSLLSEVVDGTMPVVSTPSFPTAADGYSWGRTVPNLLHYTLWKNGIVFRTNCPGMAHALYDRGLNLCSLWGDLVQQEDYVMIRPYVRVDHSADPEIPGDPPASYQNDISVDTTFGVRLPSTAWVSGVYLLADDTGAQYPFYGKFDDTLRTVHIYGVHHTTTSSVPRNEVHSCAVVISHSEAAGVVVVEGGTRTVSSSSAASTLPADPAVSDEISWGPIFMHPDSNWLNDGVANRTWTSRVGWNRLATGEYITRTLVSDTAATSTIERVDDELLPFTENPLSFGRAVATSLRVADESLRSYNEVGVDRKARIIPISGALEETFGFEISASSFTTQPSASGGFYPAGSKTITTHVFKDDLSGLDHTDTTTSTIGYIEWMGEQTWETITAAAVSAASFNGTLAPGEPTGPSGWGGGTNWVWITTITWIRRVTVSGELVSEAAARVITSANNLTGGYGTSPSSFTISFTNTPDYGLYNTTISLSRLKETKHIETAAVRTELTFGTMPAVQFDNFYVGVFDRSTWFEADGTTVITRRSEGSVSIDIAPIPVVIGYGDLRWPIAQQLTVAPWECSDSGYSFQPGRVLLEYSSDVAGNSTSTSTFEEIVFDPAESLLGPFAQDVLTIVPTAYTIEDTFASRPEFADHDAYEQYFYAATQIQTTLTGNYPGVPQVGDASGVLPAPSQNGLEYLYHYDVDPAHTVLFGLPYTPETGDTRPRLWVRPEGSNTDIVPVRIGVDGLWDDDVMYNSPIFVKKL